MVVVNLKCHYQNPSHFSIVWEMGGGVVKAKTDVNLIKPEVIYKYEGEFPCGSHRQNMMSGIGLSIFSFKA
jgi:hypothetical protein